MKIKTLTLLLISLSNFCFSQSKNEKKNTIGVESPLLLNNSNGVYYSLGNRQEPKGKALSYGIGIHYSRQLYKNWFANIGAGYYKQSFNIIRPFYFDGDTVTNLLYSTKKYNYYCIALNAGLGYSHALTEKLKINGLASFNLLNSFKQNYTPTRYSGSQHKTTQTNNKNLKIGYMANISPGIEYLLTKKISIGADIVFPIVTKWKYDEIFIRSLFGEDSQKIAENRFSIGTTLSCKYHF